MEITFQETDQADQRLDDLAHGIAAFDLLRAGLGNTAVHSLIVTGTLRGDASPEQPRPQRT